MEKREALGPVSIHNRKEMNKRIAFQAASSVGMVSMFPNLGVWQNAVLNAQTKAENSANKGYLRHIGANSRYDSKTPQGTREKQRRMKQMARARA